jgi:hypothetical protein
MKTICICLITAAHICLILSCGGKKTPAVPDEKEQAIARFKQQTTALLDSGKKYFETAIAGIEKKLPLAEVEKAVNQSWPAWKQ